MTKNFYFPVMFVALLLSVTGCGNDTNDLVIAEPQALNKLNPGIFTSEIDEADAFFNTNIVHQIHFTLPQDEWEQLKIDARDEEYIPAQLTIAGEDIGEVGIRFKGNYSLNSCFDESDNLICPKLSLKIKFNKYDKENRFVGLKKLNLHAMISGFPIVEQLAYKLYRDMAVVAPRTSWAKVYVNDEVIGIHTVVEQIDSKFVESRFIENESTLYKEAWPAFTSEEYYAEHAKTNEDSATHEKMLAFTADLQAADDTNLPEVLASWMDPNYLFRYMAVDFAIANWDGWTTFYCASATECSNHNLYMYEDGLEDQLWIIPWDMTATFSINHWLGDIEPWDKTDVDCTGPAVIVDDVTLPASCDPLLRAMALTDREIYKEAMSTLLDNYFIVANLSAQIDDTVELILPYVDDDPDPRMHKTYLVSMMSYLKDNLPDLRNRALGVLD